jgi:hypothetical protein
VYAETTVLHDAFEEILNQVTKRMNSQPMEDHLKRHLVCVFLSAMMYNPNYTLAYCDKNGITIILFDEIFSLANGFTNLYEKKVFILGLSSALNASPFPQQLATYLQNIIEKIIRMLNSLKDQESKALKKAGRREIKDDDDDEEDSNDEEDDNEDEEEEEYDEEAKGEPTI